MPEPDQSIGIFPTVVDEPTLFQDEVEHIRGSLIGEAKRLEDEFPALTFVDTCSTHESVECARALPILTIDKLVADPSVPSERLAQAAIDAVCDIYGVELADMLSPSRLKPVVTARQVACYIIKDRVTDLSYPAIGRLFGRDHTTIMHGVARIRDRIAQDLALVQRIETVIKSMQVAQFGCTAMHILLLRRKTLAMCPVVNIDERNQEVLKLPSTTAVDWGKRVEGEQLWQSYHLQIEERLMQVDAGRSRSLLQGETVSTA